MSILQVVVRLPPDSTLELVKASVATKTNVAMKNVSGCGQLHHGTIF